MPLQWQEHPPLTTEPQTDQLDIFAPDYPAQRLVQSLERIATSKEDSARKLQDALLQGWCQGQADAFRLAALWIRKDLIRDVSE